MTSRNKTLPNKKKDELVSSLNTTLHNQEVQQVMLNYYHILLSILIYY